MIQLIYVSSATSDMTEEQLYELLIQAQERNKNQNITGMLLYGNGNFMQMLEGDKQDVDEIYSSIKRDSRNSGNIILQRKDIDQRYFPEWTMGFKLLSNNDISKNSSYSNFFKKALN